MFIKRAIDSGRTRLPLQLVILSYFVKIHSVLHPIARRNVTLVLGVARCSLSQNAQRREHADSHENSYDCLSVERMPRGTIRR